MEEKNNEKVIVIQEGENTRKRFTWGDYCHQVNVFKYWILGISLVFAIVGYLILSLYWNPRHETSTSQVELNLPVEAIYNEDGKLQEIAYLDGSPYSLYDIISRSNIEEVVQESVDAEGNPLFSIDVDRFVRENGIAIQYANDSAGNVTSPDDFSYVLTIQNEYIGDSEAVSLFVDALIQNVIDRASQAIPNELLPDTLPQDVSSMEAYALLSRMQEQYEKIDEVYVTLLQEFGSSASVALNGTSSSLSSLYQDFLLSYSASSSGSLFVSLSDELIANGYVRFESGQEGQRIQELQTLGSSLSYRLSNVNRQIEGVQQAITSLSSLIGPDSAPTSEIQNYYLELIQQLNDLLAQQQSIQSELTILGYQVDDAGDVTLPDYDSIALEDYGAIQHLQALQASEDQGDWLEKNTSFFEQVDALVPALRSDVDKVNEVYRSLYQNRQASVVYVYPGRVSTTGGINAFLGAALGLVLGYLVSSIALAAFGYIKGRKKEELVPAEGTSLPAAAQAEALESEDGKETEASSAKTEEVPSEEKEGE